MRGGVFHSDLCGQIPFSAISARAVERNLILQRVPIRDFDRGDQVRVL